MARESNVGFNGVALITNCYKHLIPELDSKSCKCESDGILMCMASSCSSLTNDHHRIFKVNRKDNAFVVERNLHLAFMRIAKGKRSKY